MFRTSVERPGTSLAPQGTSPYDSSVGGGPDTDCSQHLEDVLW